MYFKINYINKYLFIREFKFLLEFSVKIKIKFSVDSLCKYSVFRCIHRPIITYKEDNTNQITTTEFAFRIHYFFEGQVSCSCIIFFIVMISKNKITLKTFYFSETF